MKTPLTPFPVTGYFGNSYFCNRAEETKNLIRNFRSGISTTLVSIRRLGKTALIHHVGNNIPKNALFIYMDIHATENLNDFLNIFTAAVINSVNENSHFGKKAWKYIQSLRPVVSFDQLTGTPQFAFDFQQKEAATSIQGVIKLLEQHSAPILVAIDEFQQIMKYPEENTDAWLRSIIQKLKNVSFIFSGSRQHMMTELFNHPSRPFYRSTNLLKLEKISTEDYSEFIIKKFKEGKMNISSETTQDILEWTERYTYYVQLLCNRIYISKYKTITKELWQGEAYKLLKEHEPVFFNFRELLTQQQWSLLKALAKEDTIYQPTSGDFISKYNLGSSAAVLRSLNSLIEKEMVYFDFDSEGKKYYKVYDLLLKKWLENI
jgi:uncharacterized protein